VKNVADQPHAGRYQIIIKVSEVLQ